MGEGEGGGGGSDVRLRAAEDERDTCPPLNDPVAPTPATPPRAHMSERAPAPPHPGRDPGRGLSAAWRDLRVRSNNDPYAAAGTRGMKHEEAVTKQTIAKRMNIIARLNFVVFGAAGSGITAALMDG